MTEWIDWKGGDCPVAPETRVWARLANHLARNGYVEDGPKSAGNWYWSWDGNLHPSTGHIIAYRIAQ